MDDTIFNILFRKLKMPSILIALPIDYSSVILADKLAYSYIGPNLQRVGAFNSKVNPHQQFCVQNHP